MIKFGQTPLAGVVKPTSALVPANNGNPACRMSMVEDISERVKARKRLEFGKAKYRAFIETAVDSIVLIDEQGEIQAFNHAAERTFGYRSLEVIAECKRADAETGIIIGRFSPRGIGTTRQLQEA